MARLRKNPQHGGQVAQIIEQKIGGERAEFNPGKFARRDGHRLRPDGAGAGDVVGRVAEDEDPFRRKLDAVFLRRARPCEMPELIAIVMIVGVGAKFEVMPDAVVRELEFRAALEIPREQREDDVFARLQGFEQRDDSRQERPRRRRQFLRQEVQIPIEKRCQVFRRLGQVVRREHAAGDAGIRPPGDLDLGQIVVDAEPFAETAAQRALPRPSRSEQRAVDIEEEEFLFQGTQPAPSEARRQGSRTATAPCKPSPLMNPRVLVLLAATAALVAKLYCAATTVGTNDVHTFYNFGRFIWENGLLAQYLETREFNHTPIVGWYCAAIYGVGKGFGYHLLLRLPAILADFFAVCVLLRWREMAGRPPVWTLVLFALSPVNFMISGFHGNVDSILAWLLLAAAWQGMRDRVVWCGLLFGLACQVKVIPLLLAPAFFFFWAAHGRGWPFFLTASGTILAGWAFPLVTIPDVFLRNVLGYSSNWGSWGVTLGLHATGWPVFAPVGFLGLTVWQTAIMSALKWGIVGAALILAWRRRHRPPAELPATLLMVWTVFFVFAPGFGVQYLVWFAPLLALVAPGWFTVITAASAVFLFRFYTVIAHGLPWNHAVSTVELMPHWVAWSSLPWLALVAFFLATSVGKKPRAALPVPQTT